MVAFIVGLTSIIAYALFAWLAIRSLHGPKLLARTALTFSLLISGSAMAAGYSGFDIQGELSRESFPSVVFSSSRDYPIFFTGVGAFLATLVFAWAILKRDSSNRE